MNEASVWIVNASPIITLAKVGKLHLLLSQGRKVLIPEAVAEEIVNGPPDDPARQALMAGWNNEPVESILDPEVIEWNLGAGETAVLSLAKRLKARAVMDDRLARLAAETLGVRVIGTLGVVLRARREGRIPSSVDVLMALRRAGLRLSDETIRTALSRTTGEIWPDDPERRQPS